MSAFESFPEDFLAFNAFTSAFKTLEPIRSLESQAGRVWEHV
jgi:hypothetical protein